MEVRYFKKDERQLLLSSIDRLWKRNHIYVRSPEVLEHLTLHTPYRSLDVGADNYSFLGMWDDSGEVVGLRGIIPQRLNFFGREYNSVTGTIWLMDNSGDKKYNGLRLFQCEAESRASMRIFIGLSDVALRLYKALGYKTIQDLPRWIAINKADDAQKVLLSSRISYFPKVKNLEMPLGHVAETDSLDGDEWDKYYNGIFAPHTVGTKRDYTFLKWRYLESPVLKYHFIALRDKRGKYCGLAVLRIEPILDGQYKIGRILEFMALNAQASFDLAKATIKFDEDVLAWDFYCLSGITAYGLEAVGFQRMPEWLDEAIMPTRFQPIDHERVKLNGAVYLPKPFWDKINPLGDGGWYITRGDADQDRAN